MHALDAQHEHRLRRESVARINGVQTARALMADPGRVICPTTPVSEVSPSLSVCARHPPYR